MGNFRYFRKYETTSIDEHLEVANDVRERIMGHIWKELNNNKDNKILVGPIETINDSDRGIEMKVTIDIIREKDKAKLEKEHVTIETPDISISLDELNKTDNELKIKSKTKKTNSLDIDDNLFEEAEDIKFEEKDERYLEKNKNKNKVILSKENENIVFEDDDEDKNDFVFKWQYMGEQFNDENEIFPDEDEKELESNDWLDEEVIELLKNEEEGLIKALKFYRDNTGATLKQAKNYITNLKKKNNIIDIDNSFITHAETINKMGLKTEDIQDALRMFSSSFGSHMNQYSNSLYNALGSPCEDDSFINTVKDDKDEKQNKENTRKFIEKKRKRKRK